MDSAHNLINQISETIYQDMKLAVELGKWKSGHAVSEQQKSICLQAIIAYEARYLDEASRTAFIHRPEHEACDSANSEEQVIKFKK